VCQRAIKINRNQGTKSKGDTTPDVYNKQCVCVLMRAAAAASRGGGREQFACDCMGSLVCYLLLSESEAEREKDGVGAVCLVKRQGFFPLQ
jgi:hypothetical protein